MADKCLILTSTIDPGGMIYTKRSNVKQRIRDYTISFEYWNDCDFFNKIIFCDNSNHPLTFIHDIVRKKSSSKKIEILSYDGNSNKLSGKGYGEIEILEYVYANSRIINEGDIIYKLTGRYIVRNIADFQYESHQDNIIACNMNYYRNWTDSRFFISGYQFIPKYLFPRKTQIDDKTDNNLEDVLAESITDSLSEGYKLDIFKTCPVIEGFSGGKNKKISNSMTGRLLCNINQILKLRYFKLRGIVK